MAATINGKPVIGNGRYVIETGQVLDISGDLPSGIPQLSFIVDDGAPTGITAAAVQHGFRFSINGMGNQLDVIHNNTGTFAGSPITFTVYAARLASDAQGTHTYRVEYFLVRG